MPLIQIGQTVGRDERWGLQFLPSGVAIGLSALMYCAPKLRGLASFVLFFGAQTFMNLYMKGVLSGYPIYQGDDLRGMQADDLRGIPAPFLITGVQQSVGFFIIGMVSCLSQLTPWPYRPKPLESLSELLTVVWLSLFFCFNIGLNNLSLTMMDMSVHIIIRSGSPAIVALMQLCFALATKGLQPRISWQELALFCIGSLGMALTALARALDGSGSVSSSLVPLGSAICMCAQVAAALELLTISCLGLRVGLNPVDIIFYMAIPSTLFLAVPVLLLPHSGWPGHSGMTDLTVIEEVLRRNPHALGLVMLSGLFAVLYNLLLYKIVQGFSAAHAALAATTNKVATILISLLLGLEALPHGRVLSLLLLLGIVGTLGSSLQLAIIRAAS